MGSRDAYFCCIIAKTVKYGGKMKKHIFLTGEIQTGKSTAIRRFLGNTCLSFDGIITRYDTMQSPERKLYMYRLDSTAGETDARLAVNMNFPHTEIFSDVFNIHGAEIIRASGKRDLIIMDELGSFEEKSPDFKSAVFEKLDGHKQVCGVVKLRNSPFTDEVKAHKNVRLITVTEENRNEIPALLQKLICES